MGLYWDARIYNTFAVPVLGYVGQLETVPAWVMEGVERSLQKVAKGPRSWATPNDLWILKEALGLQASFRNVEWTAVAAKVRVVTFDSACLPHSRFRADCRRIDEALLNAAEGCDNPQWRKVWHRIH